MMLTIVAAAALCLSVVVIDGAPQSYSKMASYPAIYQQPAKRVAYLAPVVSATFPQKPRPSPTPLP